MSERRAWRDMIAEKLEDVRGPLNPGAFSNHAWTDFQTTTSYGTGIALQALMAPAYGGELGAAQLILPAVLYKRGDVEPNGIHTLTDAIRALGWLFRNDPPTVDCEAAVDVNNDNKINISDPVCLLNHLFQGGPQPPEPYEACGVDWDSILPCLRVWTRLSCQ